MGHLAVKDIYRKLGHKIDKLTFRAPWNEALYNVLKELYSETEADVVVKMPYGLSNLDRIATISGYPKDKLEKILEGLSEKGLVMDFFHDDQYHYLPSPLLEGFFEYTMMRTRGELNSKHWAELFHAYWTESDDFQKANLEGGKKIAPYRALPHEGTVAVEDVVEILPHEKAEAIVDSHRKFAIGICACRHEAYHVDLKACDVPLESCITFGFMAEWLISHGMAKEVSRERIIDHLAFCKESGTIFSAENSINANVICCCCTCCCGMIRSINQLGYTNALMTSNFIAEVDSKACVGCGKCAEACPIHAIELVPVKHPSENRSKSRKLAKVDHSICLGCGLCSLQCRNKSLYLNKREQEVIYPATTFERNILSCLDKGTLQYQLFDNPQSITHAVMRGIVGGFLKLPPVKKAIMSDLLRSRFLNVLTETVRKQGAGWVLNL
ncbi:MAG: 4Fe-4S binding protein [Candidatus Hodarchaeota archaeon]